MLVVYTDGACKVGRGGWGYHYTTSDGRRHERHGGEEETTNNRMELTAVIEALLELSSDTAQLHIVSDSTYVVRGATEWLEGWKRAGWINAKKQPVANQDLWMMLDAMIHPGIGWAWTRGHAGDEGNILADELANRYFSTDASNDE